MRQSFVRYFIVVMMVCLSWAAGQQVVTKTADTNDGTCDADCSLREAIDNATSGNTITFDGSLSGQTITLTLGELDITLANLTIDASALANPVTIDADNNSRVFDHTGNGTLTVNNLTIQNGNADFGGGIFSAGNVTVTDSTIWNNTAADEKGGGGIRSAGNVTVTDSTISHDYIGMGGGIRTAGNLTLSCVTFNQYDPLWRVSGEVSDGIGKLENIRDPDIHGSYRGRDCPFPTIIDWGNLNRLDTFTYGDGTNSIPTKIEVKGVNDDVTIPSFTVSSVTKDVCTVTVNQGGIDSQLDVRITIVAAGTCTINAEASESNNGDSVFAAAQDQKSFTVLKRDLTATVQPATREYGDANPAFAITYTNLAPGEGNGDIDTPPTLTTTADNTTGVGTVAIACDADAFADNGHTLSSCTDGTLTITAAPLTVTADDVIITAGDTPTFTTTITGLKNGETADVFTTPVSLTDDAPNYNTAGTYTITPSGAAAANYTFTYNTGTLTIQSPGFDITESGGNTAVTEGAGADTIDVVLTSIPTADVVITVTPDGQLDAGSGVGTDHTVTFTGGAAGNWDTPQTITVTANDDTDIEGNHQGTLTFGVASADANYDGATLADISVAITDKPGVLITPSRLAVAEGDAINYDVALSTAPARDVTITITPDAQSDVGAGTGTAKTLTFNDTTPQTVTVTTLDDTNAEGVHTSTISHAITTGDAGDYTNALTIDDATVTITDNDSAGSVINPDPDMQIRNGATTAAASITSGTTINIGSFKRGEVATVDFLIRNPGAKVLEIGELVLPSFLSSAGEPLPETLGSFESALLTLDVNTSAVGALEGAFSLASNDPDANENPFVFTVKGSVSETPANVLNILLGVDLGDISAATGEDDVVLLSFKLSVPAGSTSVTVDSLTLAASNAGIERASNLTLYIDGGTRGELDNRDVLVASTDDTETLTFTFPARTFSPNVPMWFIVVGDF